MTPKVFARPRKILVAIVLTATCLSIPSHAAGRMILTCVARGSLVFHNPYPSDQTWIASGSGRCVELPSGTLYSVSFSGIGLTGGFGCELNPLEDYAGGLPTFTVNVTLSNASGVTQLAQYWPPDPIGLSHYPPGGLFAVSSNWLGEDIIGAGALITRPLLLCPPSGSDDATFAWSFRR